MIEDELLKMMFKCGSSNALGRIYKKYADNLLTLAIALLNDSNTAEDVLHDVFVSFAKSADRFSIKGSLKNYLSTCVVNRARDHLRVKKRVADRQIEASNKNSLCEESSRAIICDEESQRLNQAMESLPYEQKEVIVMRIKGGLKFKEIAKHQGTSINTVQGRYRYGLNKLRSILDGEVE
ncbi:MAG: RNA polymerase sigma factor [Planctomycetota bacterium]|jgi:RNA polymerase sigma-70 factor (ECF subfamily)